MYDRFDEKTAVFIKKAVAAALEPLGLTLGVTFQPKDKVTYTQKMVSMQIDCCLGDRDEAERMNFDIYHLKYGIPKDVYKKIFVIGDKTLRLVDFSVSSRKYVCVCEVMDVDQTTPIKRMRYTLESVKRGLGIS